MSNKYIYASSLGCTDHADFEVHFPEQLIVKPYSQIRCISCRINPSDNLLEIDSTNDLFYVGVDHWNKENSVIPLLPIKLTHGLYNLIEGSSSLLNLNEAVAEKLAEQLKPYCMLRGGSDVSMSSSKLKMKVSTMQMYGCPTQALSDAVLDYWANYQLRAQVFQKKIAHPVNVCTKTQLTRLNTHYGIKVEKKVDTPQYYISPPCVTGFSGGTEDEKYISHQVEMDLTGLADEVDFSVNKTDTKDFIRLYYGDASASNLGETWGKMGRYRADNGEVLAETYLYCLELNNEYIVLRHWTEDGSTQQRVASMKAGPTYTGDLRYRIASKFTVTTEEWEDQYNTYFSVEIQIDYEGIGQYKSLTPLNFTAKKSPYRQKFSSNPNRLALLFNTDELMEDMVSYSAAVDDPNDTLGWNPTTSAFGPRASLTAGIPERVLSVVTDIVGKEESLAIMYASQAVNDMTGADDNFFDNMFLLADPSPNADILSWDSFTDQGCVLTLDSYTGLEAQGAISGNNREFPMFYLSVPSLPLQNVTATYLQGYENKFITPIELSPSQVNQRLYTSKLFTEQYNTMTNSAPMNMSTLRIKICDINGVPVKQLDKYTIVTLEIRENPHKVKAEMIKHLSNLTQNTDRNIKVIKDQ